jgi:CRISPR-associated protein Cmr6
VIPVNDALQQILRGNEAIENAGLLLDKYHAECPRQEDQKLELVKIAALPPRDGELARRFKQRRAALEGLGATRWTRTTSGPLTLQLSRAGSFENAGICLHPTYSFVYLPGTGMKGMARAFADTVAHAEAVEIEAVFGKTASKEEDSASGAVVFHDAWPVKWPRLVVDIVNNHHPKYYQGNDDRDPPDDFEDPNPVSFLAVAAGAEFEFAVGLRQRESADPRLLALARQWLDGALTMLGAGAKTNAGYGCFQADAMPALGPDHAQFTAELKLVTPAFLAGATQDGKDCELRPATLRGLVRWWWRTLHSAHLSVSELRKLEAKMWGDTEAGGPVALQLESVTRLPEPERYEPRDVARRYQLDQPPKNHKTAQGVLYDSYGMQASGGKQARYYLEPGPSGPSWRLTVTARSRGEFTAAQLLDQARLALWLLGCYGGVGAKARRGFGSFAVSMPQSPQNLKEAMLRAAAVRPRVSPATQPVSSAIEQMQEKELRLRGDNPWFALDQLGYAYQSFASDEAHKKEKVSLGLPRKIHKGPEAVFLRHPAGQHRRHSSPLHLHLFHDENGYAVRIAAFASPRLPDLTTSGAYLSKCVARMEQWLGEQEGKPAPPAPQAARGPAAVASRPVTPVSSLKVGDRVTGTLVEKSPKGTWKANVEGFLKPGPVQNSPMMPASLKQGDAVLLKVAINKPNDPGFIWLKE